MLNCPDCKPPSPEVKCSWRLLFLKNGQPVTHRTVGMGDVPGPILLQDHGNLVQYRQRSLVLRK
jgi:hypothetical protein